MKLYYYRRPEGNFGDDLNPWLWPRLLPGLLDEDDQTIFVGLGTLLNDGLPPAEGFVVLGAGAGYGTGLPRPDARWRIYGVRGPQSAATLGLGPESVLVDPAAAVRDLIAVPPAPRRGVGFMPHYRSLQHWDWEKSAAQLGLTFVNPLAPVEETMRTIAGLERLVTEAMHGAIVADALRTPWTAVSIHPEFLPFKWHDWGGSVDLQPRIHPVTPLYDVGRHHPLPRRIRNTVKRAAVAAGLRGQFKPPWPRRSAERQVDATLDEVRLVAERTEPQLSDAAALDGALDRLDTAITLFRRAAALDRG